LRRSPVPTAAPLGAASPFFVTPADRVAWARERYFEHGLRPSGIVSEAVIDSWQRCRSAGLSPHERPDFEPVTKSRVNAALARGHAVLDAAAPEIAQLDLLLAGTGCRLILTDAHGIVLRATPVPAGGRGILDIGSRVGVDLAEGVIGSTAPAVAATSGRACTVLGGEHYLGMLEQVHCAAAPIHNRDGGLAAVLDVSIEGRPFAFDASAVVRLYAAAIENRFVAAQAWEHVVLRFALAPPMLETPLAGLAAVDGEGRVGWINAAGRSLLEHPRTPHAERSAEVLFGLDVGALLARSGSLPQPHRLPTGLGLWLAVQAPGRRAAPPPPPPNDVVPPPAALDAVHRRHIEGVLAACNGNIAAAARRLGVSRGLLYRRLRAWTSSQPGHGSGSAGP
jgi:sigma-54 dependent transcriptional regulator, acetoin dehydrogenase operon transcriptional activator AcoR